MFCLLLETLMPSKFEPTTESRFKFNEIMRSGTKTWGFPQVFQRERATFVPQPGTH